MIVKVPDADQMYEEPITFNGQTKMIGYTVLARIGSAVRQASEKHFVGASWMVTHAYGMTLDESEIVAAIFERAAERTRAANPKKYKNK